MQVRQEQALGEVERVAEWLATVDESQWTADERQWLERATSAVAELRGDLQPVLLDLTEEQSARIEGVALMLNESPPAKLVELAVAYANGLLRLSQE
jgi:hypothetical protein